jgi:hypothetical protein
MPIITNDTENFRFDWGLRSMRWIPVVLVAICWLGVLASGVAAQDRITLKNGSAFTGEILSDSGQWIIMNLRVGRMQFHRSEVAKIERGAASVRGSSGARSRRGRRGAKRGGGKGYMSRAPRVFGTLKQIRVDRHPAYDALKRTQIGAWVLYATPRHLPHHDQERWVVHDVSRNQTVMLRKYLLRGYPNGFQRVTIDHLDYGPEMPGRIQRTSTFGKEQVKIALGRFATLRITQRKSGLDLATMHYCPEVPILGLVQDRQGDHVVRKLVAFAWQGGDVSGNADWTADRSDAGPDKKSGAKPPPPNPVAAAFLDAKVGDFVIWRQAASNRRTREVVSEHTPEEVTILIQVWRHGRFVTNGHRRYDLGSMSGDYLDRFQAKSIGRETLTVAGRRLRCQKWRSKSGSAVFWTSKYVPLGALVRHTVNGRVLRELEEIGHDPSLADR